MKKNGIRFILLIVLALLLAVGLTNVSLGNLTNKEDGKETDIMDIALVNEDKGVIFNEEKLDFGDAFVQSLDHSNKQKWFVVSRGVAENGLERGTYEMIVIIPSDFSEKALSMEQEKPEQVVLDYKINASKNENVQAQAEETVSSVLNDFNRRIIDVYFASVIGNLNQAQDRISTLVAEEANHTEVYNQNINNPLGGYIGQFERVKDGSERSINTFKTFEDLLNEFDDEFKNNIDAKTEYDSNIDEAANMLDANSDIRDKFLTDLDHYNDDLRDEDVEKQLKALVAANKFINSQLITEDEEKDEEDEPSNIDQLSQALKLRLQQSLEEVEASYEDVEEALESGLVNEQIEEKLQNIIHEAFDGEDDLSGLMNSQDEKIREKINTQISNLPSLDENQIEQSGLSDKTIREISNVIRTTKAYNADDKFDTVEIEEETIVTDYINNLMTQLEVDGLVMSDSVQLPENKNKNQIFKLYDIPPVFEIESLILELPGKGTFKYTNIDADGELELPSSGKIELPENEAGEFTVELDLRLKEDAEINIFDFYDEITEWRWSLHQLDITNERSNDTDGISGQQQGESPPDNEPMELSTQDEPDEGPEIEEVEIINNYIHHQVTNPVIDDSTLDLMKSIEKTINPYQKLLSTYEMYFGFNLACNISDCPDVSFEEEDGLIQKIKDTSLYYLFNEEDIKSLLADYILNKIEEDVTEAINEPITAYKDKLDSYRSFIKKTNKNAESLVEQIEAAKGEARQLNENLSETLHDITTWREKSQDLMSTQGEIQSKDEDEKTAIFTLESGFKPLLAQSQFLADRTESNLESADNVYNTFNQIDEQASQIQDSGANLIRQAEDLSASMTEKLKDDEAYVDNFSEVLSNSRVGKRPNEDLYDFLSNPVTTENKGLITKSDTFTPYFLILIAFIVALFSSYVISTLDRDNAIKNKFKVEDSLIKSNTLLTGITVCIGIIEGLIIGLLSANYIGINQLSMIGWIGLMIVIMLLLLLVSTYLLRQLKMIGMFILLGILSLYLLFTKALGTGLSTGSNFRLYSPLQYLENMMTSAIRGVFDYPVTLIVVIALIIIGILANLFVIHKNNRVDMKGDEGATEA